MYPQQEDILNTALGKKPQDLIAIVADRVHVRDLDQRVLALPGRVALARRRIIAATITVVNGQCALVGGIE